MEVAFCADDSHSGNACYARYVQTWDRLDSGEQPMDYDEWRTVMTMMNPGNYEGITDEELHQQHRNNGDTPIHDEIPPYKPVPYEPVKREPDLTRDDLNALSIQLRIARSHTKSLMSHFDSETEITSAYLYFVEKMQELDRLIEKIEKIELEHDGLYAPPF